jgi:hypothetical protein
MKFLTLTGFGLLLAGSLSAQEASHFTFDLGAGFTQPVGNTGRNLDVGWNVGGGAGFNFSPWVGTMVDLGYNRFDINGAILNNIGFPGGNVNIFSATLDPVVHLNPRGHVDVYLIGGGGMFRQEQEFTAPTLAAVTGFNPFFGFYQTAVPVNQVVSSYSVIKPGIDAGAGFAIGTRFHGKLFAEARYNRIFNSNFHTDYLPISFGFRW